uniref:Uncharacterized protein n=1 Tax=Meloidogyne javanica TaxID=6303 RepID=A0A915M780_MELJA
MSTVKTTITGAHERPAEFSGEVLKEYPKSDESVSSETIRKQPEMKKNIEYCEDEQLICTALKEGEKKPKPPLKIKEAFNKSKTSQDIFVDSTPFEESITSTHIISELPKEPINFFVNIYSSGCSDEPKTIPKTAGF